MARADDPAGKTESAEPDDGGQEAAIAKVMSTAAPFLASLFGSKAGMLIAAGSFLFEYVSGSKREAKLAAMQDGFKERCDERLEVLERRASGPVAEEAVHAALQAALLSSNFEKARRFGQVLGGAANAESPNWSEAVEFIRALETLGDDDLQVVRILWKYQRNSFKNRAGESQEMSPSASHYLGNWASVVGYAKAQSISGDELVSRCARLAGFGLAVFAQSQSALQGADLPCYRLTTKCVRLLKVLGVYVDPSSYPSARYRHDASGSVIVVEDEDADARLRQQGGWFDTPDPGKR